MPTLERQDKDIYHYYDNYGNCYWCGTWIEAWRIYQNIRREYLMKLLSNK
jgi:hypothetical protein